jgi:hypothetical protein
MHQSFDSRRNPEMKHLISLTIGACLLLPSAGVVFATDPHKSTLQLPGMTPQKGQPGSGGANASCGNLSSSTSPMPGTTGGPPGQLAGPSSNGSNSPFALDIIPNGNKAYAGSTANPGNIQDKASSHANSQYDVACFQATIHATQHP